MNSNGTGGILPAISKNKDLHSIIASVDQVHLIDVLNVDAKVMNPSAVGFCRKNGTYVVAASAKRTEPEDIKTPVNVFCMNEKR